MRNTPSYARLSIARLLMILLKGLTKSDLGSTFAVLLSNLNQRRVFDQLAHLLPAVVEFVLVAEGRVLCDVDALALVELGKASLLQPGVKLELMDGRDYRRLLQ